jgi:hypothetical protein
LFFDHDDYKADYKLCQPFKQNCRESSYGVLENTIPLSSRRKWATAIMTNITKWWQLIPIFTTDKTADLCVEMNKHGRGSKLQNNFRA